MSKLFSNLAIFILWLLHFLPQRILARLGEGLGCLLYFFGKQRRKVVSINLKWCFPAMDETARTALAKRHFKAVGRSMLERSLLWWGSEKRLKSLIHVKNEERLRSFVEQKRPVILLAPHFVGLDAGGIGIAMLFDSVSIYSKQKNPVFDALLLKGRQRFGDQKLLSRQDGALSTIRAMRSGRPFYYLPDMDFGQRDSIFVPFFGVQTATITGLSRLAKAAGAAIVPCVTRTLPPGEGYEVELGTPWENFPSDDIAADTRRMNAEIEQYILTMPEQYYWVHRRFKTRPEGEPRPY